MIILHLFVDGQLLDRAAGARRAALSNFQSGEQEKSKHAVLEK